MTTPEWNFQRSFGKKKFNFALVVWYTAIVGASSLDVGYVISTCSNLQFCVKIRNHPQRLTFFLKVEITSQSKVRKRVQEMTRRQAIQNDIN